MHEPHQSAYSIHPGRDKMLQEVKKLFWWEGQKKDVSEFVYRCLICQNIKAEKQKTLGLLQPLPILEWKWDSVSMDFVIGLTTSQRGNNAIWVVVDRLTMTS